MKKTLEKAFFTLFLLATTAGQLQAQTGVIMERWEGVTLADTQQLANNPGLLGPPTSTTVLTGSFQAPMNQPGKFVTRFTAQLTPPVPGSYNWWITGDQKAKLWYKLGACTITSFINKPPNVSSFTPVAPATTWDLTGQKATQIMNPIQTWCIMVIQTEDNGDGINHMALGWRRPGTAEESYLHQYERPVPASRFMATGFPPVMPPMSITFGANPTTLTAKGQQTSLSWNVTDATSCSASSNPTGSTWTGTKSLTGSQSISPFFTTKYSLTCIPANGAPSQMVSVTVINNSYTYLTLEWDMVTTRVGDPPPPLTNRGGYRVLVSPAQGVQTPSVIYDVGDVTTLDLTSSDFPSTGTYYFVVICYDLDGVASSYSDEVFTFIWVPGT